MNFSSSPCWSSRSSRCWAAASGRPDPGRHRLDRHGDLLQPSGRRRHGRHDLGRRVQLDPHRPAPVPVDGRDPVPHPPVGRPVQGPRALAEPAARAAAAHQRDRLRDLRGGLGLVGGHLRHRRQDDHPRTDAPRLSGIQDPGHAVGRRHAGPPDPAVDHHDRLRRGGGCLHRQVVHRRHRAGHPARAVIHGLHRLVGDPQSGRSAGGRSGPDVPRSCRVRAT